MTYRHRKSGERCTLLARETQLIDGDRCPLVHVVDELGNLWTIPSGDFGLYWRRVR